MRQLYAMAYHELFCNWEKQMDRKLLGLADPDPAQQQQEQQERGNAANGQGGGNQNRRGPGGILGALNALANLLDIHDDHAGGDGPLEPAFGGAIGQVQIDIEVNVAEEGEDDMDEPLVIEQLGQDAEVVVAEIQDQDAAAPAPIVPVALPAAPAQPPAQREQQGLGALFAPITNSIVGSMLLPAISYGMGELLRLVVPRRFTSPGRVGLLQQQWGRSFVGGCMYLVLKDMFRLYTKHRRVVNKPLRRVRNVERKRPEVSR
jgi:hypothetical protein